MRAPYSSGVLPTGLMSSWAKRCATSGDLTAFAISCDIRAMIAVGVPVGATSPMLPGTPSSATVGTSSAVGERLGVLTANTFTRPAFTCAAMEGIAEYAIVTWPLTSAGIDWPVSTIRDVDDA